MTEIQESSKGELGVGESKLIYEGEPAGSFWIVFLILGLVSIGLAFAGFPPTSPKSWGLLIISPIIGIVMLCVAAVFFRTRNDWYKLYTDRAEYYLATEMVETLRFENVRNVSYRFKPDGSEQCLEFWGQDKKSRVSLSVFGGGRDGPTDMNTAKLQALRDHLYGIVAARMIDEAKTDLGTSWFGAIRIRHDGLISGTNLFPWADVRINSDQKTGIVRVTYKNRPVGTTTMIENNVTAGLIAINQLMPE
jgi:hypothetical protein